MAPIKSVYLKVISGTSDANIRFSDLRKLLKKFKFIERIKGDHHILYRNDIEEIINIQPLKSKAKPYQVKQVRKIILKYQFAIGEKNE